MSTNHRAHGGRPDIAFVLLHNDASVSETKLYFLGSTTGSVVECLEAPAVFVGFDLATCQSLGQDLLRARSLDCRRGMRWQGIGRV